MKDGNDVSYVESDVDEGKYVTETQALQMLVQDPELVAVAWDEKAFKSIPKKRRVVMPWLKKGIIYICTLECAKQIVELSASVIRTLKEQNGKEEGR